MAAKPAVPPPAAAARPRGVRPARPPPRAPTEEYTDDDFKSGAINIDALLGDPVDFTFPSQLGAERPPDPVPPSQLSKLQSVPWNFVHDAAQSERGAWSFVRQTKPESREGEGGEGAGNQLAGVLPVSWSFTRQCVPHSLGETRGFVRQTPPQSTIHWTFPRHMDARSKVAWTFRHLSGGEPPGPWAFPRQTKGVPHLLWERGGQMALIVPMPWLFESQTGRLGVGGVWGFVRQTRDECVVLWRFTPQLVGGQGSEQGGVPWTFQSHSSEPSRLQWNFVQCLDKQVHAAALAWTFPPQLEQGPSTPPTLPSLTAHLGRLRDHDEVIRENQTFRERYARAFLPPSDHGVGGPVTGGGVRAKKGGKKRGK